MFDQFTARARAVWSRAVEESRRTRHGTVGVDDLLCGIAATEGPSARVLQARRLDLDSIRAAVREVFPPSCANAITIGRVAVTPAAKVSLELALSAARTLGERQGDAGHLLLGVLLQGNQKLADALARCGVAMDAVAEEAWTSLGVAPGEREAIARRVRRLLWSQ